MPTDMVQGVTMPEALVSCLAAHTKIRQMAAHDTSTTSKRGVA